MNVYAIKNKQTDKYLRVTPISKIVFEDDEPYYYYDKNICLQRVKDYFFNYDCEILEI